MDNLCFPCNITHIRMLCRHNQHHIAMEHHRQCHNNRQCMRSEPDQCKHLLDLCRLQRKGSQTTYTPVAMGARELELTSQASARVWQSLRLLRVRTNPSFLENVIYPHDAKYHLYCAEPAPVFAPEPTAEEPTVATAASRLSAFATGDAVEGGEEAGDRLGRSNSTRQRKASGRSNPDYAVIKAMVRQRQEEMKRSGRRQRAAYSALEDLILIEGLETHGPGTHSHYMSVVTVTCFCVFDPWLCVQARTKRHSSTAGRISTVSIARLVSHSKHDLQAI
jgi:hypothetical protein